jgi:hypothetical protein
MDLSSLPLLTAPSSQLKCGHRSVLMIEQQEAPHLELKTSRTCRSLRHGTPPTLRVERSKQDSDVLSDAESPLPSRHSRAIASATR